MKGYVPYGQKIDYQLQRPTHVRNLTRTMLTKEQAREKFHHENTKFRTSEQPATPAQTDYIRAIAEVLDIVVPAELTKREASDWIDAHVKAFNQTKIDEKKRLREMRMEMVKGRLEVALRTKDGAEFVGISQSTYRKYAREIKGEKTQDKA